jgi:hypothetical protein
MLTTEKILSIWCVTVYATPAYLNHRFGSRCTKLKVEWEIPFNQLQGVTVEDTGIRFSNKGSREYDHFVQMPESKMWFFKEIEKYVLSDSADNTN